MLRRLPYVFPAQKLRSPGSVAGDRQPAVLVSCGSFNPVTFLHLRLFEGARDWLHATTEYEVIGGFMSPVNDAYGKKGLEKADDRAAMCDLALASSDWIMCDPWEAAQPGYQRTLQVLDHFRQFLQDPETVPDLGERRVKIMLLCGADMLASMVMPGVWIEEQLRVILGDYGVVCMQREGSDPERVVHGSEFLYQFRNNIRIFREWIWNDVSSTAVRRQIGRGLSVRYLTPDAVVEYIAVHNLYSQVDRCLPKLAK